jgi:hypothetical protein
MSIEFLTAHVDRFNRAVHDGDWGAVTGYFADDAELAFEGVPVGPFVGRAQIEAAYREQPPDDEVLVIHASTSGDETTARYAWSREPERLAGEMRLTERHGQIARLVVSFREPAVVLEVSESDGLILWELLERLEAGGELGPLDPAERAALMHVLGALERSELELRVADWKAATAAAYASAREAQRELQGDQS